MSADSRDAMLLVGEGDFSFSVALQKHLSGADITTSCLLTEADLYKRHTHSRTNVRLLREQGVRVLFEVDATSMARHAELHQKKFHKVLFNFPHVGGKSDIRRNRKLLREFFLSASQVIHPGGCVCVTLCKGQGGTPMDQPVRLWADSWQVVAMATFADLVLCEVEQFDAHAYSAYSATGYRSQDRHFRTDGALTYIFRKSPPVQMSSAPFKWQTAQFAVDGVTFLTEAYIARRLNMNMLDQATNPLSVVRETLVTLLTNTFTTVKDVGPLPLVVSEAYCPAAETNGVGCEKSDAAVRNVSNRSYHLTPVEGEDGYLFQGQQLHGKQENSCVTRRDQSALCGLCQQLHCLSLRTSLLQHIDKILGSDSFQQGELCTAAGVACRRTMINPNNLPIQHEFIGVIQATRSIDEFCRLLSRSLENLFSDSDVVITLCKPDGMHEYFGSTEFVINASYTSAKAKIMLPCNQVPELGKPDKKHAKNVTDRKTHSLGHVGKICTTSDSAFAFLLSLDSIAVVKFDLGDANVLWYDMLSSDKGEHPRYEPSLFPPMWRHDIAFWEDPKQEFFDEMKLHEIIREITDNTIKNVILMNVWTDPSTGKVSRCYREIYQSSVQAVSHDLAHRLQNAVRLTVAKEMNVELR